MEGLINIFYDREKNKVKGIFFRGGKKEVEILPESYQLRPYFFVQQESLPIIMEYNAKFRDVLNRNTMFFMELDSEYIMFEGKKCRKIYFSNDEERRHAYYFFKKMDITIYEGDLDICHRVLMDTDLRPDSTLPAVFFDLETDDRKPIPRDESGKIVADFSVLSSSFYTEDGKKAYYVSDKIEDEPILLRKIVGLLNKFPVTLSHYGYGFDLPVLKQRCDKYNIPFQWLKWQHCDFLAQFKKMHPKELNSYALNNIAKEMIGEHKVDLGDEKIWWLYNNNREKLKEYNLHDSYLMWKIDSKKKVLKTFRNIAKVTGSPLSKAHNFSEAFYYLYMRYVRENKIPLLFKSRRKRSFKKRTYGGYNFVFASGKYENVIVLDFSSMYPSLYETFNISFETYVGMVNELSSTDGLIITPSGHCFSKERIGILPYFAKLFKKLRNETKYEMKKLNEDAPEYGNLFDIQNTYKIMNNGQNGLLNFETSAWYNPDAYNAVCQSGQEYIKMCNRILSDMNENKTPDGDKLKLIANSTDSIFMIIKDGTDVKVVLDKLNEEIAKYTMTFQGVTENFMRLSLDKVFKKFILKDIRCYAGTLQQPDGTYRTKVVGFEFVKSDKSELVKSLQKFVIDGIFSDNEIKVDDVKKKLNEVKNYIMEGRCTKNEITLYGSIRKKLHQYGLPDKNGRPTHIPPHIVVAKWMQNVDNQMVGEGMKIPYIILEGTPTIKPIHPKIYTGAFDVRHFWRKIVYPPTQRILDIVFPNEEWDSFSLRKSMGERQKEREHQKRRVMLKAAQGNCSLFDFGGF